MSPNQPVNNPGLAAPSPANPMNQTPSPAPASPPWFRSYWLFALILFVFWPAGLVILLSGPIYRKQKDGSFQPIKNREKVSIAVVILLLEAAFLYFHLHPVKKTPANSTSSSTYTSMHDWAVANKTEYNSIVQAIKTDTDPISPGPISDPTGLKTTCQSLSNDVTRGRQLPTMPDSTAAAKYSDAMNNIQTLASGCLNAINSGSNSIPDSLGNNLYAAGQDLEYVSSLAQ